MDQNKFERIFGKGAAKLDNGFKMKLFKPAVNNFSEYKKNWMAGAKPPT